MAKKVKGMKANIAEKCMKDFFTLMRKLETLVLSDRKTRFNSTELRLLSEIMTAKNTGKRLISTQLAKNIGVTRSAVSQMVNRLEGQGVVKRVADDVDRKIAYIELTDLALETYHADLDVYVNFINRIVEKFGEERFEAMLGMFDEFYALVNEEKIKIKL